MSILEKVVTKNLEKKFKHDLEEKEGYFEADPTVLDRNLQTEW